MSLELQLKSVISSPLYVTESVLNSGNCVNRTKLSYMFW